MTHSRWINKLVPILTVASLGGCDRGTAENVSADRSALTAVSSCGDLRNYLAEVTTESLLGGGGWYGPSIADEDAAADGDADTDRSPTDFTETNVQEEGVDEADIVETDGEFLYVLHENELIIIDSWPANETHEVGRITISLEGESYYNWGQGMFLNGDRVVVLSSTWSSDYFSNGATQVTVVDVTDRADPQIVYDGAIEGYYTDARAIDGQLYLVTNSYFWSYYDSELWEICDEMECWRWYDAVSPTTARQAMRARLLPIVRSYFASIPDDELVPVVVQDGESSPALSCTDLSRPLRTVHAGLVLFSHLDMLAGAPEIRSTGIFGGGYNFYASRQNLYLAQTSYSWTWWAEDGDYEITSVIHKLAIPADGGVPRYEASGEVPGWTLDQFSMSEHEGLIRVATSDTTWWEESDEVGNGIYVLQQQGPLMRIVGSVNGLSPDQQIYAVRFIGDMGYVVTFQQIDPLHVIDLSNPLHPVERGELEIPGFSTYLHPFGDGLLMGIGRDGDWALQLSMFDVRDPENPTRLHQERIDIGDFSGWSEALYDHHAFTYHPERQMLALPINIYLSDNYFTGSRIYRVTEEEGFVVTGQVDHSDIARAADCPEWNTDDEGYCYDEYRWWVNMRRNVFIEDNIYSISSVGLSVDDLYDSSVHHSSVVF